MGVAKETVTRNFADNSCVRPAFLTGPTHEILKSAVYALSGAL